MFISNIANGAATKLKTSMNIHETWFIGLKWLVSNVLEMLQILEVTEVVLDVI